MLTAAAKLHNPVSLLPHLMEDRREREDDHHGVAFLEAPPYAGEVNVAHHPPVDRHVPRPPVTLDRRRVPPVLHQGGQNWVKAWVKASTGQTLQKVDPLTRHLKMKQLRELGSWPHKDDTLPLLYNVFEGAHTS
jgi:hypothetical protein